MAKIIQLDRHLADLIAAGEVVERPASAAKELVENAVDAGATQITVEIQNGGMTYLRVTDNGSGIAAEDAETAFLRHATSKLRTQEDLAAIGTMGFRGEALAAIASVSKIDLMTKTADGEGISLSLEAGVVTDRSPAGCPDGTTIVIRDLFYNTPARMKFMKRDAVESAYVTAAVQRQALAHPEVAFRLIRDGETLLQTAGNGDLYGAVYQVYGRQLAVNMLPVQSSWEHYQLKGFVTKPTATRGNRNYQQFFVNGRPIKSKMLSTALEQAYENQIMAGRFPSCVLCLEMPKHLVDVNVHPTKTEVKFASEKAVFDAVYFAVLATLRKDRIKPEMELPKKGLPIGHNRVPPSYGLLTHEEKVLTVTPQQYRELAKTMAEPAKAAPAPQVVRAMTQPERLPPEVCRAVEPVIAVPKVPQTEVPRPEPPQEPAVPEQTVLPMPEVPSYRIVGEVLDTYLIVEQAGTVLFIDKHAAHERINFEKLKASPSAIMSQLLLSPLTASLTREETAIVLENRDLVEACGYEVEEFGTDTLLVRQIPSDLDETAALETLEAMAEDLLTGKRLDPASMRDKLLHTIACKASIKAGWHTDPAEREALVKQVLEREDIKYCPHGRPVCVTLTKQQLEKQFKR